MRLCTGRTAHSGNRDIALLFLDHGTRRGWGVSVTPRPLFTPRKDPVPIVQEAGWTPGSVWAGSENFFPTGIRSPDRPARSQSLYRLRYQAHFNSVLHYIFYGLHMTMLHNNAVHFFKYWYTLKITMDCSQNTQEWFCVQELVQSFVLSHIGKPPKFPYAPTQDGRSFFECCVCPC